MKTAHQLEGEPMSVKIGDTLTTKKQALLLRFGGNSARLRISKRGQPEVALRKAGSFEKGKYCPFDGSGWGRYAFCRAIKVYGEHRFEPGQPIGVVTDAQDTHIDVIIRSKRFDPSLVMPFTIAVSIQLDKNTRDAFTASKVPEPQEPEPDHGEQLPPPEGADADWWVGSAYDGSRHHIVGFEATQENADKLGIWEKYVAWETRNDGPVRMSPAVSWSETAAGWLEDYLKREPYGDDDEPHQLNTIAYTDYTYTHLPHGGDVEEGKIYIVWYASWFPRATKEFLAEAGVKLIRGTHGVM
jgi:hypothetical protein